MKTYTLTHDSTPPQLPAGQAEVVYKCLQPFGTRHTMEELVMRAKKRNLSALFKRTDATTIPECLHYHLKRLIAAGYVLVEENRS